MKIKPLLPLFIALALPYQNTLAVETKQAHDEQASHQDFKTYLQLLQQRSGGKTPHANILAYLNGAPLSPDDDIALFKLLGSYAQQHDKQAMLALLSQLVAIDTEKRPQVPQHNNPAMIKLGGILKQAAKQYGLAFYNYDNYLFEVRLPGLSQESIGFYTHADVVPAEAKEWQLKTGEQLSPFKLTQHGDKLYGRGSQDDKGSIVAALFAMKQLKAAQIPMKKTIRLFVMTSEETDSSGLRYFHAHHSYPKTNIGLDGGYPIVVAEKGVGNLTLHFKATNTIEQKAITIASIQGAKANNIIPAQASARLTLGPGAPSLKALQQLAKNYSDIQDDDFAIEVREDKKDTLEVKAKGRSAHSSQPEDGVNPVARLLDFLMKVSQKTPFTENQYYHAAKLADDLFGIDYQGKKLGLAYSDKFMGPLTMSVTRTQITKQGFDLGINIRMPRGRTKKQLIQQIDEKLTAYKVKHRFGVTSDIKLVGPMYRSPHSPVVGILQDVYGENTHHTADLIAIAGFTTMHHIPGGISFGPGRPDQMYMGHHNNEYKRLSDLLMDQQLLINAMGRLAIESPHAKA